MRGPKGLRGSQGDALGASKCLEVVGGELVTLCWAERGVYAPRVSQPSPARCMAPLAERVRPRAVVLGLFLTRLSCLLFLPASGTSRLAGDFRRRYQSSRTARTWRRRRQRRWCGSPGKTSRLARRARTEVSVTLLFSPRAAPERPVFQNPAFPQQLFVLSESLPSFLRLPGWGH